MEEVISAKDFSESVAHDERYQWKTTGIISDDLLVLKRAGNPLIIKYRLPGQQMQYEWYKPRRVKDLQKLLGLID